MMEKQWVNYGDASPMTEGGIFVSVEEENGLTQEIDVVRIEPEWSGKKIVSYSMEVSSYSWREIREVFEDKSRNSLYSIYGWDIHEGKPLKDIIGYLAADMIMHIGGQSQTISGSDYWELLHKEGIRQDNIT